MKQFIIIFFLSIGVTQAFGFGKRAFRLLEKDEYSKLREYLDKSLDKDSINPGARYVYSLLFLHEDYVGYDIDSAYQYIQSAIRDWAFVDERDQQKLQRLNVSDSTLRQHKAKIETHAYRRSRVLHTLEHYKFFLDQFPGAAATDSVIYHRNTLAFKKAAEVNTYESYRDFMYTYPDARQIDEARKRYEQLLFRSKTSDGRLETYIRFLKNNKDTPHRAEAELNIYHIVTANNAVDGYMWFLNEYPNSVHRSRAVNYLYHLYKEKSGPQSFLNRFDFARRNDSLVQVVQAEQQCMVPVFENNNYGFMDQHGYTLIDYLYDSINNTLLCGNIRTDVIEIMDENNPMIVNRLGEVVYRGKYDEMEDLGYGLLRIREADKYGLIHKSGKVMLETDFDGIERLGSAFIKINIGGIWGLVSYSGKQILPVRYNAITSENEFVFVERNGRFAVSNVNTLKKQVEGYEPSLFFAYDDYMMMDDNHVLAFVDDSEVLIDDKLESKSKTENHEIHSFFDGWLVKVPTGYRVYDLIFYPLSDNVYSETLKNNRNLAIKKQGKWAVYQLNEPFPESFSYDSVRFLSEHITLLMKGDTVWAEFKQDTLMDISGYESVRVLQPQLSGVSLDSIPQYLLVEQERELWVYNQQGTRIIQGRYDEVTPLGKIYLAVKRNNKVALYHRSGQELLGMHYDAIGNYERGFVSTLANGKFGIYNYHRKIMLRPRHSKILRPYNQYYYISAEEGKQGIINLDNAFISDDRFSQVQYWNDTSALVQLEEMWGIYDLKNQVMAYKDIKLFEWIKNERNNKLLLITKASGTGVLSSTDGELISPTFNDVYNVGTIEQPVFFAEKFIKEADFYIVIYYQHDGAIARKQVFSEEEYWKIYCEAD